MHQMCVHRAQAALGLGSQATLSRKSGLRAHPHCAFPPFLGSAQRQNSSLLPASSKFFLPCAFCMAFFTWNAPPHVSTCPDPCVLQGLAPMPPSS